MKLSLLPLQDDDLIRVRCEGPLSMRGLATGTDPLEALLGPRCYVQRVLLNLEKAQSIDTSGISWLLATYNRFRQANGRLVLFAIPPVIAQALEFAHLTSLLDIAANEAEAVAATRSTAAAGLSSGP